jgi:hypothetical protein
MVNLYDEVSHSLRSTSSSYVGLCSWKLPENHGTKACDVAQARLRRLVRWTAPQTSHIGLNRYGLRT